MSEEYIIIRNVSLAVLALLLFSCCMCYPECLILSITSVWNKINCCCPTNKEDKSLEGYVGGKMDNEEGGKKKKKKKKRSKSKGGEEPKGLAANAGVELV